MALSVFPPASSTCTICSTTLSDTRSSYLFSRSLVSGPFKQPLVVIYQLIARDGMMSFPKVCSEFFSVTADARRTAPADLRVVPAAAFHASLMLGHAGPRPLGAAGLQQRAPHGPPGVLKVAHIMRADNLFLFFVLYLSARDSWILFRLTTATVTDYSRFCRGGTFFYQGRVLRGTISSGSISNFTFPARTTHKRGHLGGLRVAPTKFPELTCSLPLFFRLKGQRRARFISRFCFTMYCTSGFCRSRRVGLSGGSPWDWSNGTKGRL